jgi:hypothetical protein
MPLSLEIIEFLVSTGVDYFEVTALIDEGFRAESAGSTSAGALVSNGWMHSLVQVGVNL